MGTCTRLARRLGTLVLCLAVITVTMGAPGSSVNSAAKAAASNVAIPITFFAAPDNSIVNLDTNWYTKYVEQTFNLKIKWITVPPTDVATIDTKANVLLNSGDYPEVFYNARFSIPEVYKYAKQGIFVPMESYFQKYAPHLWQAILTEPGLKGALTAPDGHIYGFPIYNLCIHCYYAAKFWINVQALQQYGLQMPKTTSDFEHVLQVFKQHGLTPLTGAATNAWHGDPTTFLMNSFIYDDGGPANGNYYFYLDNNKKIQYAPIQPQWKAGLQYIHKLWSEGLIDQGAFSQDNAVLDKEAAKLSVGVVPWGCPNCFDTNYANDVNVWQSLAPLTGPSGVHYAGFFGNSAFTPIVFTVTDKATDAQKIAVAKMMDQIATVKGQELKLYGPATDGLWTPNPKGVTDFSGHPALLALNTKFWNNPNPKQNWAWSQMGPLYENYSFRYGQQAAPPYEAGGGGAEAMLQLETELNYVGLQPRYVVPGSLWIDPSALNQYSLEQTNITNFVNQWTAQFITGSKSLDSDWNSYVQGVQNLGLAQYLQMSQRAMVAPIDTMSGTLYHKNSATIHYLKALK